MSTTERAPLEKAVRIGSLLKQVFGQAGIEDQISRHQAWLIWDQLVGKQIAARARPQRLRRGVLEVRVDHPVWMQQLHLLKPQILRKINARLPTAGITDIYLRQARQGSLLPNKVKPDREPPPWQQQELSRGDRQAIEAALAPIKDEELKLRFRTLLTLQTQVDRTKTRD